MLANGMPSYGEWLRGYNDKNRYQFNDFLFERSDEQVIHELKNVIMSLERDNNFYTIKVDSIDVVDDYFECQKKLMENEISRIKSTTTRNKMIKDITDRYKKIPLKDTAFYLLVIHYHITLKQIDPVTGKFQEEDLEVLMKVPRYVDKYYFKIQGNYYVPIWQIVDGSTYNNSGSGDKHDNVTLKVMFMATRIYKMDTKLKVSNPEGSIVCQFYNSRIFSKWVSIIKYLFAKWGYFMTLSNLGGFQNFVNVQWDPENDNTHWNFKAHNMYVTVPKVLFDNNVVIQSAVYTIVSSIKRSDRPEDLWSTDFWLRSLGADYSVETVDKGIEILASLTSIYDFSTKENLKLEESHKEDIYQILLWVIHEFDKLREKDNMDLEGKRIRQPEYIGALAGNKMSRGSYRISNGKGLDMDTIIKVLRTDPNMLIKEISNDKLMSYRNICNDLDCWDALKFTFSGLSGIGTTDDGETSSSVPISYRTIHDSYTGRLCFARSQPTNPGMNGVIVPFADVNNKGMFSDKPEPDSWREELVEFLTDYWESVYGYSLREPFPLEWNFQVEPIEPAPVEEKKPINIFHWNF